ncbi:MAG: hypothetical protein P4L51_29900 [Puia sp.]|nr:hypothetical protein [Puia sp.]
MKEKYQACEYTPENIENSEPVFHTLRKLLFCELSCEIVKIREIRRSAAGNFRPGVPLIKIIPFHTRFAYLPYLCHSKIVSTKHQFYDG